MTERERYVQTLLFGKPDKIPFSPGGPRESTLKAWRSQGLGEGADWYSTLCQSIGVETARPSGPRVVPQVDFRMIPQFQEKLIQRKPSTLIVQDWKGNICEISDKFDVRYLRQAIDFVTRRWIKCPVENRADWEAMKQRYKPDAPGRFEQDFSAKCAQVRQRDHLVAIGFSGPFWQLREWCGFEGLCMLFIDDPAFVRDMIGFWRDFVSEVLQRVLKDLTPDMVHFSEDMAYKEKSMISPAMAREFLLPSWRQWTEQAKAAGVRVIDMDSDGYIGELIPLWIEAGINVCDPIEVAAGNDINAFRRQFGSKMAFRQGIDKRAMAKGGSVLAREMQRVAPVAKDGGYIPGCDHGIPSDISWPNMLDYGRQLARMTGWL